MMKQPTKRNALLAFAILFNGMSSFAQNVDLEGPVRGVTDQVARIFPWVAGAAFLIVVIANLGHFLKDSGDSKKAIINIVICAAVIGLVVALYQGITSIRL